MRLNVQFMIKVYSFKLYPNHIHCSECEKVTEVLFTLPASVNPAPVWDVCLKCFIQKEVILIGETEENMNRASGCL